MAAASKLFLGNCIEIMRDRIPSGSVHLVLCDPPYGTTQNKWDAVIDIPSMWERLYSVAKENAAIVLTSAQPFTSTLICSNPKGFRYCWVWDKNTPTGFLDAEIKPLKVTEDVCVFYRKQPTYNPQKTRGAAYRANKRRPHSENYGKYGPSVTVNTGDRYPVNLLEIARGGEDRGIHPTQKPVALMEYLVKTYSNPGDIVLDFTMGSGTTGIACKNLDRRFIGIEMDPDYFAKAKSRIEEHVPQTGFFY